MDNRKLRCIASAVILSLTLSPLAEAKRVGGGSNRGMSRSNYSSSYSSPSYQPNRNSYSNSSSSRLGGGNNAGMSRSYSNSGSNSGRSDYRNSNQNSYSNQAQPRGNNTARVIGAGVAGAAIGAMAGHAMANHNQQQSGVPASNTDSNHNNADTVGTVTDDTTTTASTNSDQQQAQQPPKSGFSWFWLIIIALGGFYLYRRFATKKNNQANMPYSSNHNASNFTSLNNNGNSNRTNIFGQNLAANSNGTIQHNSSGMADGSSAEAFLRFARQRFNHVQSMNNASNLEEIRRYFTPEMFADIRNDIVNNQDTAEFSNLNADLVESTDENGQYIASVRFSGLVSEELGSPQEPFSEVWHFIKPVGSQQEWLIAGIQQD
jgi:predicted lipid-binding transport protein (Tim44 family)